MIDIAQHHWHINGKHTRNYNSITNKNHNVDNNHHNCNRNSQCTPPTIFIDCWPYKSRVSAQRGVVGRTNTNILQLFLPTVGFTNCRGVGFTWSPDVLACANPLGAGRVFSTSATIAELHVVRIGLSPNTLKCWGGVRGIGLRKNVAGQIWYFPFANFTFSNFAKCRGGGCARENL